MVGPDKPVIPEQRNIEPVSSHVSVVVCNVDLHTLQKHQPQRTLGLTFDKCCSSCIENSLRGPSGRCCQRYLHVYTVICSEIFTQSTRKCTE